MHRRKLQGSQLKGFLLMQASNVCFAAGQIAWRRERAKLPAGTRDTAIFALPYAGSVAVTVLVSPEQSTRLAFAAAAGTISLALAPPEAATAAG